MARAFQGLVLWLLVSGRAIAQPRQLFYEGPLRPELVLQEKEEQFQKVQVFQDAWVSCKGQVVLKKWDGEGNFTLAQYHYDGCGQTDGHCSHDKYIRPETPREMNPGGPVEVIVLLTQPQWGAYYHFVVDSLSRLAWVREQYPEVVDDPTTYFHVGFVNSVGRAWAMLAGIKAAEGTAVERLLDGWWQASKVYYPPSNRCANDKIGVEPHAIRWMTQTVTTNVKVLAPNLTCAHYRGGKQSLALLVQRDPRISKVRAVLNFDEVLLAVQAELPGWAVHIFTDFPASPGVYETCKIFSCADLILGPHGAGFANLVCAKPSTPLIEFQQHFHSWDFELLAMKKNMPYFGVPEVFQDHYGPGNVSVAPLVERLQQALQKNGTKVHHHVRRHVKRVADALTQLAIGLSESASNKSDWWFVILIDVAMGLVLLVTWTRCRGAADRGQSRTSSQPS